MKKWGIINVEGQEDATLIMYNYYIIMLRVTVVRTALSSVCWSHYVARAYHRTQARFAHLSRRHAS